eukprot:5899933-Karenia_brevis.AAC.1
MHKLLWGHDKSVKTAAQPLQIIAPVFSSSGGRSSGLYRKLPRPFLRMHRLSLVHRIQSQSYAACVDWQSHDSS